MNYSSIPAVLKIDSTRGPHRKTNSGTKDFGQILKQELLAVEKKVLSGKSSAEELGKKEKTSLKSVTVLYLPSKAPINTACFISVLTLGNIACSLSSTLVGK